MAEELLEQELLLEAKELDEELLLLQQGRHSSRSDLRSPTALATPSACMLAGCAGSGVL